MRRHDERQDAIAGAAIVFVPDDEKNADRVPRKRPRDRPDGLAQPVVAHGYGAAVLVVAHVGRDPAEERSMTTEIRRKRGQRHDVGRAAAPVIRERVVAWVVWNRAVQTACGAEPI